MKSEEVTSLFTLAGIPMLNMWELPNQYWPIHENYAKIRAEKPWWLVKTNHGLIKIGWRKRVISIEWEDTPLRVIVTEDDVTKEPTLVHAWNTEDAVKYLKVLGKHLKDLPAVRPNKLTEADENILKDILKIASDQPAFFAVVASQHNMSVAAFEDILDQLFRKLENGRLVVEVA